MSEQEKFLQAAITAAQYALKKDEVPIGAVIVRDGRIIAKGFNLKESKRDPLAHAEIIAIRKAAKKLKSWRLCGCTLYVTLEPCPMCAGAIINSRIDEVVFGAYDPKAGAFGSVYDLAQGRLNHKPRITGGVLQQECSKLLTDYFQNKR